MSRRRQRLVVESANGTERKCARVIILNVAFVYFVHLGKHVSVLGLGRRRTVTVTQQQLGER